MKTNITGTPDTITVDGKAYTVTLSHWGTWTAVVRDSGYTTRSGWSHADLVETKNYHDLYVAIREWVEKDKAERAAQAQQRKAKRTAQAKVPVIEALFGTEVVQVRGRHQRGGHRHELLITMSDGTKTSVYERHLTSLTADKDALVKLDAELAEVNEALSAIATNKDDQIKRDLHSETIEIVYDHYSTTFTGTYKEFSVTTTDLSTVEGAISNQVLAAALPFSVIDGSNEVQPTSEALKNERSYNVTSFATLEEAERYQALISRRKELRDQRSEANDIFDYEAELAKVQP
jgi:hypothetical protein